MEIACKPVIAAVGAIPKVEERKEVRHAIAGRLPSCCNQQTGPEVFNGKGMFLTLQVGDAAVEFERLKKAGVSIAYPVKDEPWGQRRFGVFDPAGIWVDVVQQIEPAPGFWEKYIRPE